MSNYPTAFKKAITLALMATVSLATLTPAFARDNDRQDNDSHENRRGSYDREHDGHRAWSRGQRLSREDMRENNYYRDWRDAGLRAPPRGSQWLMLDGQFVLVTLRTGIITEIRIVPHRAEVRSGDRDEMWRKRYSRAYSYNDDVAYTECRSKPDPAGVLAGALLGGLLGNAAGGRHDRGGATAAGVVAGGALGAALTSKMDCGDRSYAYQTYSLGFNGGRANASYQWTNPQNNHRGEMRVLDYYNDEDDFRCAVFTQTVYINNRPEEARGRACQQPNGTWAIID